MTHIPTPGEPVPASQSFTQMARLVLMADCNGRGKLYGGTLMAWIDMAAMLCARRFCGRNVTTALVDQLSFLQSVPMDATVVLQARVTYTGRTSMEVRVDSYLEALDHSLTPVSKAYLVVVALDDENKPAPVPRLLPQSPQDEQEMADGAKRDALRKARRSEGY